MRTVYNGKLRMNRMIEFYFAIHYVIYRYYRKRWREDPFMSLLYACALQGCLSVLFWEGIDDLLHRLFDTPYLFNGPLIIYIYAFTFYFFEYLIFYRKEKYLEVFDEYDREIDNPAVKKRLRRARIFNSCILALDLISLFVADYCNHH